VRWSHPVRGAIPPVTFIPVAEANGLIAPLGRFVLREACRQAARWRREGLPLQVAVNVSPLQFGDGIEAEVDRALADCDLPSDALELEVTESVLMDGGSRSKLDDLAERGVGIAIDDFGTGYSSLAYLKRLRAHTLKIDKSFIDGLPGSLDDCMLVGSVIRLAHSFGMVVVAEGVEILDQVEVLDLLECDLVQGYAISRPVPAEDIPGVLATALP
jgi:EAL domain-containing protein (putative c-di-GMP-specific phosphodiesterase class I)